MRRASLFSWRRCGPSSQGAPLNRDVITLFTDGEEAALLGAQAFVDEHPWMADVKVALNMGLLYRGPAVIWSTNAENGWLIAEWAKSVRGSASASLLFSAFMVGDTDLTPFLNAGVRRGILRFRGIGIGILAFLMGAVISAGSTALLFDAVCRIHPEYSLNSHALIRLWQPHLTNGALYLGAFILLTASVVSAVTVALRKKASIAELAMGVLFIWLVGAIALTFVHPGSAYAFHWPLLLGLGGLALTFAARSQPDDAIPWGAWFLFVLTAVSALLLWVPSIYMFYLWTAFILPAAITGLAALVLGIVIPPLELHRLRSRWAYLRFDPSPPGGLDLEMDILSDEPVEIRLVGVSTGLPSFSGIITQSLGLTISPPDYGLDIPTDFTAVHRRILLPASNNR